MSRATEVIERTWKAPIALVWELWTTPEGIARWFGPQGFSVSVQRLELEPGGSFDYTMTATDPKMVAMMESRGRPVSWPAHAVITEVQAPNLLAYDLIMPMGPDRQVVMKHTVVFTETAEGVHMVFTLEAESEEVLRPAAMGYRSSVERFGRLLAT